MCKGIQISIDIYTGIHTYVCTRAHTNSATPYISQNPADSRRSSGWYMDVVAQAHTQAWWLPEHRNELFTTLIRSLNCSGGEECWTTNARIIAKDAKKNKEKNSSENTEVLQTKGFEYALNVLLVISPLVKNCRATNPQKLSYTPFIYTVSP